MKKILYILPDLFKLGGIARYNQNFLNVLIERKYLIKIISKNDIENKYKDISILSFGKFKNIFLRKIFFSLRIFWEAILFKPDLIISGHINFSPICLLIDLFFGKNYILITYGIDSWDPTSKCKILGLRAAEMIISVSNYTKQRLLERFPGLRKKIFILPNAVDGFEFFPKAKSKTLLERFNLNGNSVILTVARLSKLEAYKGYDKIIEALPKIVKEIPHVKYLIVGGGDDLPRVKKITKDLGLREKVIFAGVVSEGEIVDFYNLCDLFIMPSKQEGFGIVFLEALACGKPVIAGNKDGSRDALLDGKLGILVDPDNIDEIAKAIIVSLKKQAPERILEDSYLRKRVVEEYGFNKFKKNVGEFLKLITKSGLS